MLSSIKAVLFDHDDTLVATYQTKSLQHKHIAKVFYNKDLQDQEIKKHWGAPLGKLMSLLYETDDEEMAMKHNIATRHNFPKKIFPKTIETLKELKSRGLAIGIVTATKEFSLQHDLQTLGFPDQLFDYIQTEEHTQFHKPDPKVFDPAKEWLSSKGIEAHEALYVGDAWRDREAAVHAGLKFLGVATGVLTVCDFIERETPAIEDMSKILNFYQRGE